MNRKNINIFVGIFFIACLLYFSIYWTTLVGLNNFLRLILPMLGINDILYFGYIYLISGILLLAGIAFLESIYEQIGKGNIIITLLGIIVIFSFIAIIFRPFILVSNIILWATCLLIFILSSAIFAYKIKPEKIFIINKRTIIYFAIIMILVPPIKGYYEANNVLDNKYANHSLDIYPLSKTTKNTFLGNLGNKFIFFDANMRTIIFVSNIELRLKNQ